MIKQIMIPAAAFAITATGASAFSGDLLKKIDVDLTTDQITALEEVHELHQDGADRDEIRELLENAGLDRDTMQEIREATHEQRELTREAVQQAFEDEDYEAYQTAVANTPHADMISSEADFRELVAAHQLRQAGDHEAAAEIMSDLGFEKPERQGMHGERQGDRKFGDREGFGPKNEDR